MDGRSQGQGQGQRKAKGIIISNLLLLYISTVHLHIRLLLLITNATKELYISKLGLHFVVNGFTDPPLQVWGN